MIASPDCSVMTEDARWLSRCLAMMYGGCVSSQDDCLKINYVSNKLAHTRIEDVVVVNVV